MGTMFASILIMNASYALRTTNHIDLIDLHRLDRMFGTKKTNVTSTASDPQLRYANGNVIDSEWRLEKTIGKGSYGKVKQGYNLLTGQRAALKFIARSSIKKPAHWTRIRREINLLLLMRHPHVVGLWEAREQEEDIMLVMELVRGADLFERIVNHDRKHYGEGEGRRIFRQIIEAVDYCHQHRIIHRDLKPENIMIDENGQVKLIDFGFANLYHPKDKLETNCGSPLYAAPEIVQGVRYVGPEVDIWSLGVVLYAMLTGTLPFEDEQLKGLYAKICKGEYREPEHLSEGKKHALNWV